MKAFPTNFTVEKNRKTGAAPRWILKCPFASGTVYLSDLAFTVPSWEGGITTVSWVKEWGKIDEDIAQEMSLTRVADFSLQVIIDPGASPDIEEIIDNAANNVETTDLELYLWFKGLDASTDPPQLIWVGNIVDYRKTSELVYQLDLADQSVKLDKYVGNLFEEDFYMQNLTFLDPDIVGKMANIVIGDVRGVPCHCVAAGGVTSLSADITAASPGSGGSLTVNDASHFPASPTSFSIRIGDEILSCTGSGSTTTINVTARGAQFTVAAPHKTGDQVIELPSSYRYLVADHEVVSVTNVKVDGVLIPDADCRPNGYGGDHKAQVWLTHGPVNPDPETIATAGAVNQAMLFPERAVDGNESTYAYTPNSGAQYSLTINYAASAKKSAVASQEIEVLLNVQSPLTVTVTGWTPSNITNTSGIKRMVFTKTGGSRADTITFSGTADPTYAFYLYEAGPKKVYTYKTGSGGSSAAKINIGNVVTCDVTTAGGTYYADQVIQSFLTSYAGWPSGNFITDGSALFVSKGYRLSVLINEYKKLREHLGKLAFQCRSYFRFAGGKAYLLYRPDSLSSDKTITNAMIRMETDFYTTVRIERSPLSEVINKINLRYKRDWSKSGDDAYSGISKGSDATSITRYGEKERADLFIFDYVRSQTMADDLRAFYLARYKDRKKVVTLEAFLDNVELELADGVTVDPLGSLLCEVQKVNISPGSGRDMKNDRIQLVLRQY